MFRRKVLAAAVVVMAVMSVPSWGAQFRRITDQQFLEMCEKGDAQGVIEAVKAGADVNAKTSKDWTALMGAALNGRTETVKVLIEAGADVNAKALKATLRLCMPQ